MASNPPYREIRALYDSETITLYQAYPPSIADPALASQRLDASPAFLMPRMTWIKPSWNWMMYRSGYSFKDANQSRVLATRIPHSLFRDILLEAAVCRAGGLTEEEKKRDVRVQWDPERDVWGQGMEWRSLQVGLKGGAKERFVRGVVGIEDVTGMARGMKSVLDTEGDLGVEEMRRRGLVPVERVYEVDDEARGWLEMDVDGEGGKREKREG